MSWKWMLVLLLLMVAGYSSAGEPTSVWQVPRISKEDLRTRLGSPDLVLLDVRQPRDWAAVGSKIAGAIREDPREFARWRAKYPKEKTLVLYCA
jgi:rhodanese-related sulfurtransferase